MPLLKQGFQVANTPIYVNEDSYVVLCSVNFMKYEFVWEGDYDSGNCSLCSSTDSG